MEVQQQLAVSYALLAANYVHKLLEAYCNVHNVYQLAEFNIISLVMDVRLYVHLVNMEGLITHLGQHALVVHHLVLHVKAQELIAQVVLQIV